MTSCSKPEVYRRNVSQRRRKRTAEPRPQPTEPTCNIKYQVQRDLEIVQFTPPDTTQLGRANCGRCELNRRQSARVWPICNNRNCSHSPTPTRRNSAAAVELIGVGRCQLPTYQRMIATMRNNLQAQMRAKIILCMIRPSQLSHFTMNQFDRARQLYKNISMLFLFPVKDGKLSTGVNATFNASCYG